MRFASSKGTESRSTPLRLRPWAFVAGRAAGPRPARLAREGLGLLALLVAAVLLFDLLPFLRLALAAFAPQGSFAPEAALTEITSRAALRASVATLETATASALLALALGTLVTLALAVTDARGRRPMTFLFVLSMLVAPQVTALAFLTLAGPSSPLLNSLDLAPAPGSPNPLMSREGIILVLGLHHAPLVFVVLAAGLKRIPHVLIEAAEIEGAAPSRIVRLILLPLLRPHLAAAGLLAFVAGVGNFGIPALLGMPVNYLTLPTLIYRRLSSFGPSIIGDAAALGLLVAAVAGAGVLLSGLALRDPVARLEEDRALQPFWRLGRARLLIELLLVALIGLVLILPLAGLLTAALVPSYGVPLTPSTVTLDNFVEVLHRQPVTGRAFRNSLLFAGGSALVLALAALPLAWALDRRAGQAAGLVSALIEVPYALPGIVLAVACILLFLKPLPLLGVSLYATPWIIVFAYLARFLPVALKPALAAMAQLETAQEEAAALDGANLGQRLLYVVAPTLLPAAAAGGLMAFLLAFNELTVSALLWSAGTETLGVVLFSLEEAGLASQAAAVAVTTVVVIAAVMALLDRLGDRLPEGTLPWRP
ncbi:MAG: ABC transporter permease subunit [Pseudomonadota bacterium]|nr:ABC transporter permease subunit [Pseudomonadota bacterium]